MICPKCHTEIADGAKFCTHCGCNLSIKEECSNDNSSKIILAWVLIWGFSNLLCQIVTGVFDDWYASSTRYIAYTLWIISNISYLLIPFSVKNKTIKIISLLIIIPFSLWFAYCNIRGMIASY